VDDAHVFVAVASHHQGVGAAQQGFDKATGLRHNDWLLWAECVCSAKICNGATCSVRRHDDGCSEEKEGRRRPWLAG